MGSGCLRRLKPENLLRNTAFGIFIGFESALVICLLADLDLVSSSSLVTGTAALFGATLAVFGVLTTIDNQNKLFSEQKRSSLRAAKATLPLTLRRLAHVTKIGAKLTATGELKGKSIDTILAKLSVSNEVIRSLQSAIEFASEDDGEKLANLIRSYQVLNSRTERLVTEKHGALKTDPDLAVQWAVLYRQIGDCYKYARGESEAISGQLSELELNSFFLVALLLPNAVVESLATTIKKIEASDRPGIF